MGLDPALFFEAIDSGPLDLPYLRMKGKVIAERDFDPSFRLTLAAKDAGLVQESAERRAWTCRWSGPSGRGCRRVPRPTAKRT